MNCTFCKIVNKEIPADFIYEDTRVVAFKDIRPAAPVHYLIVPREHIPSILHLKENHETMISKLIFTTKKIAEKSGLAGYKIVVNVGREGGQLVDHLHFHLLGGWVKGDEMVKGEDLV